MNEKNSTPKKMPDDTSVVMLPCKPEQFKDFISSLLGRPQTITRHIRDPFEITKDDINSIHHLLDQRISVQNKGVLIGFTADISYDDKSAVTLSSFEDFMAYAEVKPLVCESLHVNWRWIIEFTDRAPEKQDVSITFMGSTIGNNHGTVVINDLSRLRPAVGGIVVRIAHTDRSWGGDIDSLLKGAIELLTKPTPKWKKFFDNNEFIIGVALSITYASTLCLTVNSIVSAYTIRKYEISSSAWDRLPAGESVYRILNYIARHIINQSAPLSILSTIVYIILIISSIFFGFFSAHVAGKERSSFVLLTRHTEEKRKEFEKKQKDNWKKVFGGIIVSLIIAILAKVAGAWIIKLLGL